MRHGLRSQLVAVRVQVDQETRQGFQVMRPERLESTRSRVERPSKKGNTLLFGRKKPAKTCTCESFVARGCRSTSCFDCQSASK